MVKAKKLTKKGRPAKRTAKRGVSKAAGVAAGPRTRPPKRKTARNVRNRASSVAKAETAGRMGGPSIPLRDLIRGGMPRSPKARGGITGPPGSIGPQARRRMNAAQGWRAASGTSMMQYQPGPLEHVGTQRAPIRKG